MVETPWGATVRPPVFEGVATDLDGTAFRSDGSMSPWTCSVLSDVADRSHVFLATARGPWDVVPLARSLGILDPVVALNGACVVDPASGRSLKADPLEPSALEFLMARIRRLIPCTSIAYDTATSRYCDESWALTVTSSGARVVMLNGQLPSGDVLCVMVRSRELESIDELPPELSEKSTGVRVTSSAPGLLEFSSPTATKAAALQWSCHEAGIDPSRLVTFGDMPNDIEMIRMASVGVAVANAHPSVHCAATLCTSSNDDDGVARVLSALVASGAL